MTPGITWKQVLPDTRYYLTPGINWHEELPDTRNYPTPGISWHQVLLDTRNYLTPGITWHQELPENRNYLTQGITWNQVLPDSTATGAQALPLWQGAAGYHSQPPQPTPEYLLSTSCYCSSLGDCSFTVTCCWGVAAQLIYWQNSVQMEIIRSGLAKNCIN